jgi:hypothetical protein
VWFQYNLKFGQGAGFQWDVCHGGMTVVFNTCRGWNPDSAGGWFDTFCDFWLIDPSEQICGAGCTGV